MDLRSSSAADQLRAVERPCSNDLAVGTSASISADSVSDPDSLEKTSDVIDVPHPTTRGHHLAMGALPFTMTASRSVGGSSRSIQGDWPLPVRVVSAGRPRPSLRWLIVGGVLAAVEWVRLRFDLGVFDTAECQANLRRCRQSGIDFTTG
jgi:hypothetical protein